MLPHNHQQVVAEYQQAGEKEVKMAITAALDAQKKWAAMQWYDRAAIFMKAADLLAGPWRDTMNAATMLGQSKNAFQAEIDAAAELTDFFRFNCYYAMQIFEQQPPYSPLGSWNRLEYRPLEGFVFAVTPFNFTSIAGNQSTIPLPNGGSRLPAS